MGIGLKDFAGRWRIERRIRDSRSDRDGAFTGIATFEPQGATLLYREAGELRLGEAAMTAEQSHVWRQEGTRICVVFSDGRPFHCFEMGVTTPVGRHDCAPDVYLVSYDFGSWPVWRSEWTVTGPRKGYVMTSAYRLVE